MNITQLFKSVPIDLGQGNCRFTTKGKQIALSFVSKGHGKSALDVGCREGAQSRWLQSRGYKVTSIDVENHYKECIVMDVNQGLQFPNESFDLVWCTEVIEHLDDPVFFREEVIRVLKPNGRLVLTTPNSAFWFYPIMRCLGQTPKKLQNPTHKHFFGIKDIRRIFPPSAKLFGFFPYFLIRLRITRGIGLLSPTFVVIEKKSPHPHL